MTALKWTITTQERNALVETHLGCIWWTINKNRRLISAAGLDDEDVFQQLAIRMIRAVENYDPDKGTAKTRRNCTGSRARPTERGT